MARVAKKKVTKKKKTVNHKGKSQRTAKARRAASGLSHRHEKFCLEYIKHFNGAAAARAIGTPTPTSRTVANELLAKPDIQERVRELIEEATKQAKVDAQTVLLMLAEMAMADIASMYEPSGALKSIHDMPAPARKLIAGFEVAAIEGKDKDGKKVVIGKLTKVRLRDQLKVIELLGKHTDVKAFMERVEHSGMRLEDLIAGSYNDGE